MNEFWCCTSFPEPLLTREVNRSYSCTEIPVRHSQVSICHYLFTHFSIYEHLAVSTLETLQILSLYSHFLGGKKEMILSLFLQFPQLLQTLSCYTEIDPC